MSIRSRVRNLLVMALTGAILAAVALPALASDLRPEVAAARASIAAAEAAVEVAGAAVEAAEARRGELAADRAAAAADHDAATAGLLAAIGARQGAEARAHSAAEESARALGVYERALDRVIATLDLRDRQAGDLRALAVEAWKTGGDTAKAVGVMDALLTAHDVGGYLGAVERLGFGARRTHDIFTETNDVLREDLETRTRAVQRAIVARQVADRAAGIVEERLAAEQGRRTALLAAEATLRDLDAALERADAEVELARAAHTEAGAEARDARAAAVGLGQLAGAPGPGALSWPTDGPVTSGFGPRMHPIHQQVRSHRGIDIPGPTGQAVLAAAAGTVVSAGAQGGYGLTVEIDHEGGIRTLYAHLSGIDVRVGQRVEEAERIGALGSTGQSTGPHLHYEVHLRGAAVDPLGYYSR